MGFLLLAASASVWHEMKDKDINYYRYMDIDRKADMTEIKRAYRKKSIELHPDKNPNKASADADFAKLGAIHEILIDKKLREAYDVFGAERVEQLRDKRNVNSESNETQQILGMCIFYIIWSVLGYFLTLGKIHDKARMFYYGGLVALGCFEFSSKFMAGDHLKFVRFWTIYEQIDILHRIFPAYLNACRMFSQATFVDEENQMRYVLESLCNNQKQIINMLIMVLQNTDKKGRAAAAGVVAGPALTTVPVDVREALEKAQEMMGSNPRAAPNAGFKNAKPVEQKKSNGLMNFVWMVAVYAFFNYVLG